MPQRWNASTLGLFQTITSQFYKKTWKIISTGPVIREGWWDGSKCHRRRQWNVPVYAFYFEIARNSNHSFFLYFHLEILKLAFLAEVAHFFSSKILRWLKIRREFIRFLNYENHEDSWKIELFFDDVISGQDDVIGCWFFTAWKVLGWTFRKTKPL